MPDGTRNNAIHEAVHPENDPRTGAAGVGRERSIRKMLEARLAALPDAARHNLVAAALIVAGVVSVATLSAVASSGVLSGIKDTGLNPNASTELQQAKDEVARIQAQPAIAAEKARLKAGAEGLSPEQVLAARVKQGYKGAIIVMPLDGKSVFTVEDGSDKPTKVVGRGDLSSIPQGSDVALTATNPALYTKITPVGKEIVMLFEMPVNGVETILSTPLIPTDVETAGNIVSVTSASIKADGSFTLTESNGSSFDSSTSVTFAGEPGTSSK